MSNALQIKNVEQLNLPQNKLIFNELHFTESAPRYDIATRLLSLGRDEVWKRYLVEALPVFENMALEQPLCLDLASGTGDVAFALAEKFPRAQIEGLDLTAAMLEIANKRNKFSNVFFRQGDMCRLDYPDSHFDIVTGSYALRNAPDLAQAIAEIARVLKPNGVAAFLDFSKPVNKLSQISEYWLLRIWGSFWGLMLHGNPAVHGYISASLLGYPDRVSLNDMFRQANLIPLQSRRFLGGVTELTILRPSR